MGWKGWENFAGGSADAPGKKLSRGARMHAKPAIVDENLTVISQEQAKAFGVEGTFFHSTKEAKRYVELRRLQDIGAIAGLERQVRFPLYAVGPDGVKVRIGVYSADFVYTESGARVVEDVKGQRRREDLYLWKRRHLEIQERISIREV
jgi:hypothetical protein